MGTKYLGAKFEVTDDLDVNGATQLDGTLTVGVDDTGHDVKFFGDTSGKYMQWDASANQLRVEGGIRIDSSSGNAIFKCDTGNLKIQVNEADHDLLLQSDDGSGSIATYIKLDGQNVRTAFSKNARFSDNVELELGDGGDFYLIHDGTTSKIINDTGDIHIQNNTNDGDIILRSDDGSGGTTAYLTLDGTNVRTKFHKAVNLEDDVQLQIGNSQDLKLYHNGSHSYIAQIGVGNLYIQNEVDDGDIIFMSDDGSGGVAEYFRLDGSASSGAGFTVFPDSSTLAIGDGYDMRFQHNGTNSYILNYTGNIEIEQNANDKDIILKSDDGSGGTTAYITLDGSATTVEVAKDTNFASNVTLNGNNPTLTLNDSNGRAAAIDVVGNEFRIDDVTNNAAVLIADLSANPPTLSITSTTTFSRAVTVGEDDTGYDVKFYGATSGRFLHWDESEDYLLFRDNTKGVFGNGADLKLYHDATNSYIENGTGNLYIMARATDADMSFQCDDGSGGDAEYFRLDGGQKRIIVSQNTRFEDTVNLSLGGGNDLKLYHNGSASYIDAANSDLYIRQEHDDADIIFQCDDGSGGNATYIKLDGSQKDVDFYVPINFGASGGSAGHDVTFYGATSGRDMFWDTSQNALRFDDSAYIYFGSSNDFKIYHDGSNTYQTNDTGHMYFINYANDSDIVFQSDDGSGGNTAYLTLDGGLGYTTAQKTIRFDDSVKAAFGSGLDLQLYHNGSHSYIENNVGNLAITNKTDDGDIILSSDDGSGGTTAYITLDGSAGHTFVSKNIRFLDSVSAVFGTSSDMYLFHDGSNGSIRNDTGNLTIFNNADDGDIIFQSDDGSGGIETYFFLDGSSGGGAPFTQFPDGSVISMGTGQDLRFQHDGSNSYIESTTSNLYIKQSYDDGDIIFQNDDGSGGTTTYFKLDGSRAGSDYYYTTFPDKSVLEFGTGNDMQIWHDGSNSQIKNVTGNLTIRVDTDDGDIKFESDDGSGGVTEYFRVDGGEGRLVHSVNSRYLDNVVAMFGAGADLQILSDGNDGFINNQTNHLYITNNANDCDVVLRSDDGSGGVTPYITLDGGLGYNTVQRRMVFSDSAEIYLGTGSDMLMWHNGSHTYYYNGTGDWYLRNSADDKDIIFQGDDGAGGVATYFFIDGSKATHNGSATTSLYTVFPDLSRLTFGDDSDLNIRHDGTDSAIENTNGDLYIQNQADDKDIVFTCDDGSGGSTAYLRLDGSVTNIKVYKDIVFADNIDAHFGTGGDLRIYHDGTDSRFQEFTGNLNIINYADDKDIVFQSDDGSGGITEYFRLDGSEGYNIASKHIMLEDNVELRVGGGADLKLYHDGSNSYISDDGTGVLYIRSGGSTSITVNGVNTTFAGNITANGNIIGDDGTNITNINRIESDSFAADADNTTTINMGATQIDCLVADTDVFQVTDSSFIFDGAIQTTIKKRKFTKTTNTDGNADGDIVYFGGTTSMTTGAIYHYKSDGTWELADADSAATCDGLLGVALGAASNTNGVLLRGMVTLDHDPGAVGDVLFVSTTAGDATATAPSGSGDIVRVIGYCIDASNGQIWFNPDGTFVEVA